MLMQSFTQETRRMLLDVSMLGGNGCFGHAATIATRDDPTGDRLGVVCRLTGHAGTIEVGQFGAWAEPGSLTIQTKGGWEDRYSLATIARNIPGTGQVTLRQDSARKAWLAGKTGSMSYTIPLAGEGYTILPLPGFDAHDGIAVPVSSLLQARSIVGPFVGMRRTGVAGFDHLWFETGEPTKRGRSLYVGAVDGYRAIRFPLASLPAEAGPIAFSVQAKAFDLLCRILSRHRGGTVQIGAREESRRFWREDSADVEARMVARFDCPSARVKADFVGYRGHVWEWAPLMDRLTNRLTIQTNKGLLQSWARILGETKDGAIHFAAKDGLLTLTNDEGGTVDLPSSVNGAGEFSMGSQLLLSSISTLPSKTISLSFDGGDDRVTTEDAAAKPIHVGCVGSEGTKVAIMPLYRDVRNAEEVQG